MHIETQHLHLEIPLILLSLYFCVFFSLLFLPLRNVCIKVLFLGRSSKGMVLLLLVPC